MKPIVLRIYLGLNIKGSNFIYIFSYFISRNPIEIVKNPQDADIAIFEYDFDVKETIFGNIPIVCLSKGNKPRITYVDSYLSAVKQLEIAMQAVNLKAQIEQKP